MPGSAWMGGQVPVGYQTQQNGKTVTWNGQGWESAPDAGPNPNAGPQGGQSINWNQTQPGGYTMPNTTVQQSGAFDALGGGSTSGAPGSVPSLSQSAYEAQQNAQLQANLQADAEARRLEAIKSVTGGTSPHVDRATGIDPNEAAARATAFGRAKELAGNNALAAVTALNDVFAGRGLHGSTVEGGEIGKAIAGGKADVNSYITKQLIEDLNRAADVGDTTYQGNITQRGQDLNQQQTLLGLIAGRAY